MATAAIITARQLRMKSHTTDARQNAAQNQVLEQRMHGRLDEVGDVVHHHAVARRAASEHCNSVNLRADIVGHVDGVGARLAQTSDR